jgi:thioredoxin-related protein
VDVEGDVEITDFEGRSMPSKDFAFKVNNVRATPVMAFYDLDGKQVMRYTGATRDKQEFLLLTEFVEKGLYKQMRFTRYKRERQSQSARP